MASVAGPRWYWLVAGSRIRNRAASMVRTIRYAVMRSSPVFWAMSSIVHSRWSTSKRDRIESPRARARTDKGSGSLPRSEAPPAGPLAFTRRDMSFVTIAPLTADPPALMSSPK